MNGEKGERSAHSTSKTQKDRDGITINITIHNTYSIGNKEIHIEQRAEGGGQINKNVGVNANQGGQNALDHSQTKNNKSQFADGNGRSGIAGDHNDEAGGQQGIKVRDSLLLESIIKSRSTHSGGFTDGQANAEMDDSNQAPDSEQPKANEGYIFKRTKKHGR